MLFIINNQISGEGEIILNVCHLTRKTTLLQTKHLLIVIYSKIIISKAKTSAIYRSMSIPDLNELPKKNLKFKIALKEYDTNK